MQVRPSVPALSHQTLVDVLTFESSRAGNGEHGNGCTRYKVYTTDVGLNSEILYLVNSVGDCSEARQGKEEGKLKLKSNCIYSDCEEAFAAF